MRFLTYLSTVSLRDYYDDGTDPIAPLLVVKGDNVEIDGIALFKKDRYIGKISTEQTVMFAILHKSLKIAEFDIKFMDRSPTYRYPSRS